MNSLTLAFANIRFRRMVSMFNVLMLGLSIAMIITLLHLGRQVEQRFTRDLQGIDLVVGAKGSPLQLILSSVFHLDIPTGNIPLAQAQELKKNPLVKFTIPVSLGDSYHGLRIVGTNPDYPAHYGAQLAQGAYWTHDLQVVLGSEAARLTGLTLGQSIIGSHGLTEGGEEHDEFPYIVVGILKPTGSVIDRLILTDTSSVWRVHEHEAKEHPESANPSGEKEITALLVGYSTPLAAVSLPRLINKNSAMQSASPAFELARLLSIIGIGSDTLRWFALLLAGFAGVGFFITLFTAVNERRYDLALMRSLGASRGKLFALVLTEGLLLGVLSVAVGLVLGHGAAYAVALWLEHSKHMVLTPVYLHPYEPWVALFALAIAGVAAIIPAVLAYRTQVASVLTRGL